jgi:predicted SnoaL-like aldol condensation-catalyzing enzyme
MAIVANLRQTEKKLFNMGDTRNRKQVVNILDQYFEGIFNNEVETIPLSDNISFQNPLVEGVISGKEDVLEFLSDVAASFVNAQYHVERDIIDGDYVFSLVKVRLSQGQVVEMGHIFEMDAEGIKSVQVIFDPRIMLE